MAFTNNNTSNIKVTAKLTPYGRQQLLAGSANTLITKFALGDSDANYFCALPLSFGEVPDVTGELGFENSISNSVFTAADIKYKILADDFGSLYKSVEVNSSDVLSTIKFGSDTTLSGNTIDYQKININSDVTSGANLFRSMYLPITSSEYFTYTGQTNLNGGFSDTIFSDMRVDDVLIINISGSTYGELINGRDINVTITTTGGTYNIYSTFQRSSIPNTTQDSSYKEIATKVAQIGPNLVFLFSDEIQQPNNDVTKSWATGYNQIKPFSNKGKEFYNMIDNASLSLVKDKMIGYVVLDKGFVVITDPTIVSEFDVNTSTVVTNFKSVFTEVSQDISCIVNRGEFSTSTNTTYSDGDLIRVSEVGLYDGSNNLVALGKINKQIELGANQFLAIAIKITV